MTTTLAIVAVLVTAPPRPTTRQHAASINVSVRSLTDLELRQQVDAYLGAFCTPVRAEQWRSLGERANGLLQAVVSNPSALPTRRARAIVALAALNATGTSTVMQEVAVNETEPVTVRFAAVRALASVTEAAVLTTTLQPLLERARDARVRAVTAEQLAARNDERGCAAVRRQLALESAGSRVLFARAAARCVGR